MPRATSARCTAAIGQHSARGHQDRFFFYKNLLAAGKNRDLVVKIPHISKFRELNAPGKYHQTVADKKNIRQAIHNLVTVLPALENEPGKPHSLSGGQVKIIFFVDSREMLLRKTVTNKNEVLRVTPHTPAPHGHCSLLSTLHRVQPQPSWRPRVPVSRYRYPLSPGRHHR